MSPTETESYKVEVRTEQRIREPVQTGTIHHYYRYMNLKALKYSYREDYARGFDATGVVEKQVRTSTTFLAHNGVRYKDLDGNIWEECEGGYFYDYAEPIYSSPQPYTVYSSRTINYTYHFYKWGNWSDWTDTQLSTGGDREVNTRTVYRYADKVPHYEYTYERWTDWTAWGDTSVTASSTRKVKQQTIYKYRDKTDIVTYHYYQWGAWSDYRDEKVDSSDTREVQERTMYRYKEKR